MTDKLIEKCLLTDEILAEDAEMIFNFHMDISGIKNLLWQECRKQVKEAIPIISHVRDLEWMGKLIDAGVAVMDSPDDVPENLYTEALHNYLVKQARKEVAEEIKKALEKMEAILEFDSTRLHSFRDIEWQSFWQGYEGG